MYYQRFTFLLVSEPNLETKDDYKMPYIYTWIANVHSKNCVWKINEESTAEVV